MIRKKTTKKKTAARKVAPVKKSRFEKEIKPRKGGVIEVLTGPGFPPGKIIDATLVDENGKTHKIKARGVASAPATMQEAKIVGLNYDAITTAVTKGLLKRNNEIMAELAKIEGIRKRCEEVVAVVERSEILLTKMDAKTEFLARQAGPNWPHRNITASEELGESTKEKLGRLGVPYETTVIHSSSDSANCVPLCAILALDEVRATYLPDARIEPASDRMGRLGRFYPSKDAEGSDMLPLYVDFRQSEAKIRADILALGSRFSRRDLSGEQEKVTE